MSDAVTIDQLRTFVAVVDEGTFSAAARRLKRSQSVISYTLANLEAQLGIQLFDRSGRVPVLTKQGSALVAEARAVAGSMDMFRGRAKGLAGGHESELVVAVDIMLPMGTVAAAITDFQTEFPTTAFRLHVQTLGGVLEPVLQKQCSFGITSTLKDSPDKFAQERLCDVRLVIVAARQHPLAAYSGEIPLDVVQQHTQLVLADHSSVPNQPGSGMNTHKTWRLADLCAQHAFLKAGLGWGSMPFDLVETDLATGVLVPLLIEGTSNDYLLPMSTIYLTSEPPGEAGRWLMNRLRQQ